MLPSLPLGDCTHELARITATNYKDPQHQPLQPRCRNSHLCVHTCPSALQAWAWQRVHGGGLRGLYGSAAVCRGLYIAHAVLAFNFARDKVETLLVTLDY